MTRLPKVYDLVIVIAMVMPPGPIIFLLIGRDVPKVAVFVIVVFPRPLMIVDDLISVPDMVVVVVRVIHSVIVVRAGNTESRTSQRRSETP
jgi:hypothetical protein